MNEQQGGHPRFYEILKKMAETHSQKNADYAKVSDPLSNLKSSENYFELPGYIGTAIRMADKWERFTNLVRKGFKHEVQNESIKDTLIDLAVYCILESILIEEFEEAQNNS